MCGLAPTALPASRIVELVETLFLVTCPFCGEEVEIYVEPDVRGTLVQDCEVCCNPWLVRVSGSGDDRWVEVSRTDGTD